MNTRYKFAVVAAGMLALSACGPTETTATNNTTEVDINDNGTVVTNTTTTQTRPITDSKPVE